MKKDKIIKDAIHEIETLNYNGLQMNSVNYRIKSYGKEALKKNDNDLKLVTIKIIAKNVDGFKYMSLDDPETKHSLNAKEYLIQSARRVE